MANTKITSRVIADNAVTSSAIADGAITASKIASDAIDIVADTTPQLGGDLDVNGNAIAGSTVQINGAGGELMISATENGPVALRYDNNLKLTTKSDGVDITGELQSDSLDVDGDADISGTIALGNLTIAGAQGTDGQVLTSTGSGIAWEDAAGGGVDGIVSSADATAITIDSSENVGIGTTSPSTKLNVSDSSGNAYKALTVQSSNVNSDAGISLIGGGGSDFRLQQPYNSAGLFFYDVTNNAERMRINSAGSVLIGTSTTPAYAHKLVCSGSAIPDGTVSFVDTDVSVGLANAVMSLGFTGDTDATSGYFIYMTDGNGAIGSIQAASGTSVSFNTTSDERLKTNIVDASPQLDIIKSIRVREFDWTRNDHHELGLIAQELVEIVPNVVTVGGEDETKNPYGVDYGKLTPYLIKALQEQQTIIDDLKSRIETLEE